MMTSDHDGEEVLFMQAGSREPLLKNKVSPTDDEYFTANANSQSQDKLDQEKIRATFASSKNSSTTSHTTQSEYRSLKRRWYILLLYCMFTVTQVCVWNTFGPISTTARKVFGWEQDVIALLNNLGPIAYIITGIFFSWVLNVKGLRMACLISSSVVAAGTLLRCITMETPAATGLVITGHFFNGLGGPVSNSASPKLSASWFPLEERATATTLGSMALYLGLSVSFVLGPTFVHEMIGDCSSNSSTGQGQNVSTNSCDADEKEAVRLLLIVEAVWAVGVCALIAVYFPSKPYVPPSASSTVHREDFVAGSKALFRNKQVCLMALVYAMSLGMMNIWSSLLHVILSTRGISQQDAGNIGFYATVSSMCFALTMARFVDKFMRTMKYVVIFLFGTSVTIFFCFILAYIGAIPSPKELFFFTIITCKACLESTAPILFELSCEQAYPIGEGMTTMLLTYTNNILALVFLSVSSLPNIGVSWMNWTALATISLSVPLLGVVRQHFHRRDVDLKSL